MLINQEVHSQIPHDITKMNDNINMDSTIAGLMNTHSWLATNQESIICWLKIITLGQNNHNSYLQHIWRLLETIIKKVINLLESDHHSGFKLGIYWDHVAKYLVFCVVRYRSLFFLLSFFLFTIVLPVFLCCTALIFPLVFSSVYRMVMFFFNRC